MIEQLSAFPDNVVAFIGRGKVTRASPWRLLNWCCSAREAARCLLVTGRDLAALDFAAIGAPFLKTCEITQRLKK
jgi:hypothetical protein